MGRELEGKERGLRGTMRHSDGSLGRTASRCLLEIGIIMIAASHPIRVPSLPFASLLQRSLEHGPKQTTTTTKPPTYPWVSLAAAYLPSALQNARLHCSNNSKPHAGRDGRKGHQP